MRAFSIIDTILSAGQTTNLFAFVLVLSGFATLDARADESSKIVREDIEWCRMWVPGVNHNDKPRILLIGDSITEAYSSIVDEQLRDIAYVAKLATSKSLGDPAFLEEVALVLRNAKFRVIHFNNGMHGSGYNEIDYRRDFPKLVKLLKHDAPDARLIWATTTSKRVSHHVDQFDSFTERIKVRNAVVQDFARKLHIPIDDLFALVEAHPEFYSDDGTHFNESGVRAQGLQVSSLIKSMLKN